MTPRLLRGIGIAAATFVAAWTLRELVMQLRMLDAHAIRAAIALLPMRDVLASVAFTACSLGALAVVELLACRAACGDRVPARRALRAGAMAHALCNTLGFHAVLAPTLRVALYRRDGVDAWAVARIVVIVGAALVAGTVIAVLLAAAMQWGGAVALVVAVITAVAVLASLRRLPRVVTGRMPTSNTALAPPLATVAFVEAMFAMAALFVLMPEQIRAMPAHFVLAFVGSATLGVVSHAPGGVGVFEAGMLASLPGDRARILAALLVFRVVYNLLPASVAGLAFVVQLRGRGISSTADTRGLHAAARDTGAPVRTRRSADVHAGGSHR
ncbi:putative bifunctional lysylphosphatidylglycerol flippase/synthetase [Lysobacter claricitrinus]|uniref:hypothetical protein n=1 Tax=Lysobacter claricitrinus TaxID=3367728 RepID=UPI0037DB37AA